MGGSACRRIYFLGPKDMLVSITGQGGKGAHFRHMELLFFQSGCTPFIYASKIANQSNTCTVCMTV